MEDRNPTEISMMERAIEALTIYRDVADGVIPLRPGRKEPIERAWGAHVYKTPADVATAWTDHRDANIGVPLRSDSLVLDIDTKHMPEQDPWASIKRLDAEGVTFERTLKIRTATGGEHWVHRARPNPQRKKAIGFLPGLDLITAGGFVVAAGSVIAAGEYEENADGGEYTVIDDREPAMAPDQLHDTSYVEELRRETSRTRLKDTTRNLDPKLVGQWTGDTLYPAELWQTVHNVVMVRMGFMRFLKGEPPVPTFEPGYRHMACSSYLGWARYRPWKNFQHWDKASRIAIELIAPSYAVEDHKGVEALISDYWEYEGDTPLEVKEERGQFAWETDAEFVTRQREEEAQRPIEFPVEVFPYEVATFIGGLATNYHIPRDFAAIPVMTVASAAVGSVAKVKVDGWAQPLNIYAISIGVPGSGKAEGFERVMHPLWDEGKRRRVAYEGQLKEYEAELKMWKIGNSVWESKYKSWINHQHYAKNSQQHSCRSDCPEPTPPKRIGTEPEPPSWSHLYTSDGTIEAITRAMSTSNKFGMFTDELAGMILGLNQYKGGKGSDKAFIMNAWKGVPSMILRADESRSITIDNPFLTIYGTIQPDVARLLLNDKGWDDGFLDRWLFAYPGLGEVGLPGREDLSFLKTSWNNVVTRLLSLELGPGGEPFFITLDEEAYGKWIEWQEGFSAELNGGAEPRGPLVKLSQYVMRFIGILHMIRWAAMEAEDYATATVEDVEGAIKLFDYFRRGLNRIYATVFVDVTDVTATSVTRSCVVCERDITHKRSDAKVCGDTCRQALKRKDDVTDTSVTSVTGGET